MATLATNKKAHFDYEILETFEAGMILCGHEVKSAKLGHVSMKGSFVRFESGKSLPRPEVVNLHISKYKQAGKLAGYDPDRPKKLLFHKREIDRLIGKKNEQGLTLIPIKVYTKNGFVKLAVALARGKKLHDKRESLKKKDVDRDIARAMKSR